MISPLYPSPLPVVVLAISAVPKVSAAIATISFFISSSQILFSRDYPIDEQSNEAVLLPDTLSYIVTKLNYLREENN